MRSQTRTVFCVLFVLMAGASASADAPRDYEIKLVRPPTVGQRYTMTADAAMIRKATFRVGDMNVGSTEEGFGLRLEGTVEVLVVNGDGEEASVACTIGKCVRITAEGESELVPAGRVVTAVGGKEDTIFVIDEGELSPEATEALELVLRMGEDDGYNDDKIYGTAQRQPVGGTWPIDARAASDEAAADDLKFDPSDVAGSLKLEAVEKVNDVECLRITGDTRIKQFVAKAPENMTFEAGSLKARYAGLYPIDPRAGTLGESMSVTYTATFHGKNDAGQPTVVDSEVQRAADMKRTFLQPE